MKKVAYGTALIAVLLTFAAGINATESIESSAVLFLLLNSVPYALISVFLYFSRHQLMVWVNSILLLVLSLAGVATLLYEMFIHKDAQSALAFVVIPLYQLFIYLLLALPAYLFTLKKNNKAG